MVAVEPKGGWRFALLVKVPERHVEVNVPSEPKQLFNKVIADLQGLAQISSLLQLLFYQVGQCQPLFRGDLGGGLHKTLKRMTNRGWSPASDGLLRKNSQNAVVQNEGTKSWIRGTGPQARIGVESHRVFSSEENTMTQRRS
ncbi:MAG: hypothetical protein JWO08_2951 [Verrucomicrobiaceae bacterium]|nr:hypothetical protein [Verrucomicrobiaceae bacterium]